MDLKKIIIVILIIAVIAIIGGYFLPNSDNQLETAEHTTILLSKSAYMSVPDVKNAISKADKNGIFYYKDNQSDINITSCSNLSASSSVKEMKKIKESIATGSKKIKEDNVVIYEKNGTYSIFVKNTQYNDTLLIQSTNKDLLLQCWESIKYHDPTDNFKPGNDTKSSGSDTSSSNVVDAVQQTQTAVKKSTSSSTSSVSSSSSSSGSYGNSYSDFVSSSKSSSSESKKSSLANSYGDSYSDFV